MAQKKKTKKVDVLGRLYGKMGRITYQLSQAEHVVQQAAAVVKRLQKEAAVVVAEIEKAETAKTGERNGNIS